MEFVISTGVKYRSGPPKLMKNAFHFATTLHGSAALPFVISTEAYPDFLPRCTGHDHVCGFH
jgi:hypothetical protein